MSDQSTPMERLYNLHTFEYELQTYPSYTYNSDNSTKKNFPKLWRWIKAALTEKDEDAASHGVKECLIVLFGEGSYPTVVAYTWYDSESNEPPVKAEEVPESVEPTKLLQAWLAHEPLPEIGWKPYRRHKVASFYLLYETEQKSKAPESLSGLLYRPTYMVSQDGLLHSNDKDGTPLTVEDVLSASRGQRYYQRLCVVFGCVDETSASHLSKWSSSIVCGLITTWGGALEVAKERAQAAELESQAWSHEVGNFIRYLDWSFRKDSRHLHDLAIDFLEIGTRASVKFQELPQIIKDWSESIKAGTMLEQAIELGAKFAVLRNYRGGDSKKIATEEGFNQIVEVFKARFTDFKLKESRLRITGKNDTASNQRIASFAQFIIFALYSAARHSDDDKSIEVELERNRLLVKNRLHKPILGETPKSEVRAILHQAFRVLCDNAMEDDFICRPEGTYWITEIPLPDSLWEGLT